MEMKIDDFLDQLNDSRATIKIAIGSATSLLQLSTIPIEIRLEIQNKLEGFKSTDRKYENILDCRVFDEKHERNIALAGRSYDINMMVVCDFLDQVNTFLLQYGDGPAFLEDKYLCNEPFAV